MKLRVKGATAVAGLMVMAGAVHAAATASTRPVDALATIDAQGHVRQVVTRQRLTPRLTETLHQDLAGWVRGPARHDGRSSWSQMMFHLALETTPTTDGRVDARFRLLSMEPAAYDSHSIAARWQGHYRPLTVPRDPPPPPASYVAKAGGTELP
ncbi:MAG: hypothetical protein KGN77_09820 [Xanthomonadaceae bacterium]|nr:hypothetical protein [Xanthomonadaceae bacterium]MDE1963628.1 hypothetical protein [Xanthomonadaceae bacterium]